MLLSGFVIQYFDWPVVFLIVVPVVIASLAIGWFIVPTSKDPDSSTIDLPGAVLSTAGLVALVYGLIEAPRIGWTSLETLGLIVAGLALLGAFALWELRTRQ